MRIALASCSPLPEPDLDEAPSLAALREAGHEALAPAWDDEAVDWAGFDLVVLRATWDYAQRSDAFLSWVDRVGSITRLTNPPELIRWNIDKRYLLELQAAGVLVVPTRRVASGDACDAAALARERGWDSVVVKPAIGAGSWQTRRFGASELDHATRFAAEIGGSGDVLIQQARDEFDDPGERSIVWIGGEFTHAVVKQPRYADDDESVARGPDARPEERALLERILAELDGTPLYARLDVIPTAEGPMVSEVELIEPSLFFPHHPKSLEVFVRAVEAMGVRS